MKKYVEYIINEMEKQNISAYKIEEDIGLSHSTILSWKRGTQPSVDKFIKVIKYLGLSADKIFDLQSDKNVKFNNSNKYDIALKFLNLEISLGKSKLNILKQFDECEKALSELEKSLFMEEECIIDDSLDKEFVSNLGNLFLEEDEEEYIIDDSLDEEFASNLENLLLEVEDKIDLYSE